MTEAMSPKHERPDTEMIWSSESKLLLLKLVQHYEKTFEIAYTNKGKF